MKRIANNLITILCTIALLFGSSYIPVIPEGDPIPEPPVIEKDADDNDYGISPNSLPSGCDDDPIYFDT